jgi:short-subunit dehydrogenase
MKSGVKRGTALITGATSGIGYELSKLFALDGYDLVLVARARDRLEKTAAGLRQQKGTNVIVLAADLALPGTPAGLYAELEQRSIAIDVLVNNAGFNVYGPFAETDLQKELQMIQVNLASLTHLTKLLLPGMVKRGEGKILNVGSTGSFVPGPLNAVYCATKAYVLSFSDAIAEELTGTGVTVTTLCPGATRTEFAQRAGMEQTNIFQGTLMDGATVALIGYRAVMRGRRSVIAGCMNKLTIFSIKFAPRFLVAKITKRIMGNRRP